MIQPSLATASPARKPMAIERLRAAGGGVELQPPALGRLPFDALRFAAVFRHGDPQRTVLLFFVDGHPSPLWTVPARVDFGSFDLPTATSELEELRHLLRLFCRRAPHLRLDRSTFDFLAGAAPAPLPGPLLAFATGVAAILGRLEGAPPAAERIDAAEIFDLAADGPALERPPSRTVAVRTPPAAAAEPPPAAAERAAEEIACHHCGHRQPPAPRCARCGAVFLAYRRQPESRLAAPVAGDLAAGTVESPSRWGLTFLAGESLASLVLAQLGQHASALLAIAVTPWLAAVGGIAILALLTSLPSTAGGGAVFSLAAYSLSVTAVAIFVDRNLEGRPPTVGQALGSALRVLPAVLASRLLATLRILLGLAALIVPGLIYAQRAAFIEILAACQPEGRPDVSRGQMSRNLVDGYEASVLAYLLLAALAGFALIGLPAYAAVLLDFLGLEWLVPLDSPPFLALGVLIALGLAALALTGWAVLLYFLYRELADQQGMALYRGAEGLDLLARFVLITDLILLLLAVYRTSGLVG